MEKEIIVYKSFNSPVALLWQAWSNPQIFVKWFGPDFYTVSNCNINFLIGESFEYCLHSINGKSYCKSGVYLDIIKHKKISYSESFIAENGTNVNADYYGINAVLPNKLFVSVAFNSITNNVTESKLIQTGIEGEYLQQQYIRCWNECFYKLEECLSYVEIN